MPGTNPVTNPGNESRGKFPTFTRSCWASAALGVGLSVSAAAIAGAQSGWCSDPSRNRYVDIHMHGGSAPLDNPTYEDFLARLEVLHEDAVANSYTANLIVNLPSARWWADDVPAELKTHIVISGVVRPHARNEGEVVNGVRYPDPEGDPLRHIDQFARLGARAIKMLARHNGTSGLGSRGEIRHCAKFDDWAVRPPYIQQADSTQSLVDCVSFDDDSVPLGRGGATFYRYFRRAALNGLNVIVHGDERFGNGDRAHQGVEALAKVVERVRNEFPDFKAVMLHGPQLSNSMLPGGAERILSQEGLYWETSANKVAGYGRDYAEALAEGDEIGQERAIEAFESFLGEMYTTPGIGERFVFGSDVHNPLSHMPQSTETFLLQHATFTAPDSPFAGLDPAELFCERGATIHGLP